MPATREGETVNVYASTQRAPYGTLIQGVDDNNLSRFISVDKNGYLNSNASFSVSGSPITEDNPFPVINFATLVPAKYDEINLTYVSAGNGIGEIETVIYKLSSSTIATLTLSYDGSNRLSGVVKT